MAAYYEEARERLWKPKHPHPVWWTPRLGFGLAR
jgi:hypothetical protein